MDRLPTPPHILNPGPARIALGRFFQTLSYVKAINLPTSCRNFHDTVAFKISGFEISVVLNLVWEGQISNAILFTLVIKLSSVYAAVGVTLWLTHSPSFENKGSRRLKVTRQQLRIQKNYLLVRYKCKWSLII